MKDLTERGVNTFTPDPVTIARCAHFADGGRELSD
jgi:hypothetical protein